MTLPTATLCFLVRGRPARQVLLGYKKRGFGQGKYNGIGGKVEPGEPVAVAAQRELFEETGVSVPVDAMVLVGVQTFHFPRIPDWNSQVYVYRLDDFTGEPVETDEIKPEWFDLDKVPFEQMWDDDRYWLSPILAGLSYSGYFTFSNDLTVEKVDIQPGLPISTLPLSPSPLSLAASSPLSIPPSPHFPFSIIPLLAITLRARSDLLSADPQHETVIRLFNGFLEGCPELVVDLYGDTLLMQNHADPSDRGLHLIDEAQEFYLGRLPWIHTVVVKNRLGNRQSANQIPGKITYGETPTRKIYEHGVWYTVDLLLHQDNTFYPDTRLLRRWAIDHLAGKRILNAFAYTGSLGVAALDGGATQVVQLDHNPAFLDIAKESYELNDFSVKKNQFLAGDFFPIVSALKRDRALFDCVFLDPPFFSVTGKGRVDLVTQSTRLINKVRPLIADNGWLVAVNNALFVSGKDYIDQLEGLCADGYLAIEELIPVPRDSTGYANTRIRALPADPSPFNHATKIAVLKVKRKV